MALWVDAFKFWSQLYFFLLIFDLKDLTKAHKKCLVYPVHSVTMQWNLRKLCNWHLLTWSLANIWSCLYIMHEYYKGCHELYQVGVLHSWISCFTIVGHSAWWVLLCPLRWMYEPSQSIFWVMNVVHCSIIKKSHKIMTMQNITIEGLCVYI